MKKNRRKNDALFIAHRKFLYKYLRRSKQILDSIYIRLSMEFFDTNSFLWEQAMLWIRNDLVRIRILRYFSGRSGYGSYSKTGPSK